MKQDIYAQNLKPQKEYMYYLSTTNFRCATGWNEIEGFIYLRDSAYLWAVFSFKTE